jgi:hypothetical protein
MQRLLKYNFICPFYELSALKSTKKNLDKMERWQELGFYDFTRK